MILLERAPDQKQLDKAVKALSLSQEEVEEMGRAADPDPNWKNGQWILKQWVKGNVHLTDTEAVTAVHQAITKLEQAKKAGALKGNEKNLDGYKRFEELVNKLNSLPPEAFVTKRSVKKKKANPLVMPGSEQKFADNNWQIYHATTKPTMELHGKGTAWCTAVHGGAHQDGYLRKGGTYIIYASDDKLREIGGPDKLQRALNTRSGQSTHVPSEHLRGGNVIAQFTSSLSELRNIQNIAIPGSEGTFWGMADRDGALKKAIESIVNRRAANRYFRGDEDEDDDPTPIEEVRAAIGEPRSSRIDWAFAQGYSVQDGEGDNLRSSDRALRAIHRGDTETVYIEHPSLSGSGLTAQSNKRSYMRDHYDATQGNRYIWQVGHNGDISVAIDAPESAWNAMTSLDDYPLIDEMDHSNLLHETAVKNWMDSEDSEATDFKRYLKKRFEYGGISTRFDGTGPFPDDRRAPESDKELTDDEIEFMNDVVEGMSTEQLWALASMSDGNFPNVYDEGDNVHVHFDHDFLRMALDADIENIIRAREGMDDATAELSGFDGDFDMYLRFLGDEEAYNQWAVAQRRQSRLFPTGEPESRVGDVLYPGESVMEQHEYATTQVVPPIEVQDKVRAARELIDPEDLDPDEGFGDTPHVTLLYGLGDEQQDEAVGILQQAQPLNIRVADIDVFEPGDYDVVILRLESDDLQQLHDQLSALPNDNEWSEYKPHMTVAYVKPGEGAKYREALDSDLIGKNFVANEVEFSNTTDDKTVVDLHEGTTAVFENLREQSPLFGTDILTEEPDKNAILGALYPVLNRANRRAVSINSDSTGPVVLLDNGTSLNMTYYNNSWWAETGAGQYDLMSPTDQERLVKELQSVVQESALLETSVDIKQDGYNLVLTFIGVPETREIETEKIWPEKKEPSTSEEPSAEATERRSGEAGVFGPFEADGEVERQYGKRRVPQRFNYTDEILPLLVADPELAKLGEFKPKTANSVEFVPHWRSFDDTKATLKRLPALLQKAIPQVKVSPTEGDRFEGITQPQEVVKSRTVRGGTKPMTYMERIRRAFGKSPLGRGPVRIGPGEEVPAEEPPADPAAAASPTGALVPADTTTPSAKPKRKKAKGGMGDRLAKWVAGKMGYKLTKPRKPRAAGTAPRRRRRPAPAPVASELDPSAETIEVTPEMQAQLSDPGETGGTRRTYAEWPPGTTPEGRRSTKRIPADPEDAVAAAGFEQCPECQAYHRAGIPCECKKSPARSGVQGAEEDTYTSDVGFTDTIPITRPERKRRRGSVKLKGLKDAARRRVNRVYRVMGEGISKKYNPIRVVMRPSQVEALEKKPVWSALHESGVVSVTPFKMGNEEFFEVTIDTLRREWTQANTEILLDEVGAVSPQTQTKILERVSPEVAAARVLDLVDQIAEAQAEAELEEGARGNIAEWIRGQKLSGKQVTEAELKTYLLGSVDHVASILEGIVRDPAILELLKTIDRPEVATEYPDRDLGSIAKAAHKLTEDKYTDTGGSLGSFSPMSGAAAGAVTQGYAEQDDIPPDEPMVEPEPTEVAVSSRTWADGAMFKLHIQKLDGTTEWVFREVVGNEGEDDSSELVYKDEAGNIMRIAHDTLDKGMEEGSVLSPDETGIEAAGEVPNEVGMQIAEPIGEQAVDPEIDRLNRDTNFTQALSQYQQSKNDQDWDKVREAAQRATSKTGPELDRILGQFSGEAEKPEQQPMESLVNNEVRSRVVEDREVKRHLRRFRMTQNEAYLHRATDRAQRLGARTRSRARRLIDEIAGAAV